jgi:hypothetical protein
MKTAPFLLVPILAACGSEDTPGEQPFAGAEKIECALGGAAEFRSECAVERLNGPEGLVLVVRAPSGSFRRLSVTRDGRGIVAADGADPARVSVIGEGRIEVAIAGDRYRLPATVRP